MFNSARAHRWQPTRLPHPWDSSGKNTGVGCHFLLQCMKVKSENEVTQSCPTQRPHGLQPTRLLHPWDFPGKSTGVGRHLLSSTYYMLTYINSFNSSGHYKVDPIIIPILQIHKLRSDNCLRLQSW